MIIAPSTRTLSNPFDLPARFAQLDVTRSPAGCLPRSLACLIRHALELHHRAVAALYLTRPRSHSCSKSSTSTGHPTLVPQNSAWPGPAEIFPRPPQPFSLADFGRIKRFFLSVQ